MWFLVLLTFIFIIIEGIQTNKKVRNNKPTAKKRVERWEENSRRLQEIKDKMK